MNVGMNAWSWLTPLLGIASAAGAQSPAAPDEAMIVTAFEQASFVPVDPARPDGAQMAVLWGDPERGPSAMLMKFARGEHRVHVHSADYHLVVLRGTMKHYAHDQVPEEAAPLGPGSYWFQPGGAAHAGSCLSDECLMFIKWEGRRDARLAE